MDLRLMGNVEIYDGTRPIPLPRAGERCVLASLALEPARRIHIDTLVDRLWGDDPPTGAGHTIASYVRTVRKAIEDAGGTRNWLRNHRPATYQLDIDPNLIDYHRFTELVSQARIKQRDGKPADAVALYQGALQLRTAEALANVTGQWAANRGYAIEQEYLDAACALFQQQLTIGDYHAVADRATQLVMEVVPTDRMIALAIHGLARSDQHAGIRGFLARASQRMWATAQARPSRQVLDLARRLIADPTTRLSSPQAESIDTQAPDQRNEELVEQADSAPPMAANSSELRALKPANGGLTIMTAEHNQHVYQAAGDQYITGGP